MANKTHLGTFNQISSQILDVGTEFAGHVRTDWVAPGQYPVTHTPGHHSAHVTMPARVYCDNWVGSNVRIGETGGEVTHRRSYYCFEIARLASLGVVELAPDYGWRRVLVPGGYSDGRDMVTYRLTHHGVDVGF
jgi:hypothetical protein